jgi:hypothetical protein
MTLEADELVAVACCGGLWCVEIAMGCDLNPEFGALDVLYGNVTARVAHE